MVYVTFYVTFFTKLNRDEFLMNSDEKYSRSWYGHFLTRVYLFPCFFITDTWISQEEIVLSEMKTNQQMPWEKDRKNDQKWFYWFRKTTTVCKSWYKCVTCQTRTLWFSHSHEIMIDCSTISVNLTEKERHIQIFWYWRYTLDVPLRSHWKGFDGTISVIVRQLNLFKGSKGTVENVLKKSWFLHTKDNIYDGCSARVSKTNNNPLAIKPESLEE